MSDTPPIPFDHEFERGLANRRAAMGDGFVDRAIHQATDFNAEFQNFMTRYAWQGVWGRPGLDWSQRRLIVLAVTAALGRWEEFDGHLRGALTPGNHGTLTVDQVREALIQLAIYAGVPAANTAFARASAVLQGLGHGLQPLPADEATHPGSGRSVFTASRPRLHASVRQPRRGPARATVVLSHALGLDGSMFDAVADRLTAALPDALTLICPDTRGHGRSELPPGALTMAELAEDAARLLDECSGRGLLQGPVLWAGISMGGMVGQELALRHPGKLNALLLANTVGHYTDEARAAIDQRVQAAATRGLEPLADATLARFFTAGFLQARPQAAARTRRLLLACDPEGYAACAAAVRDVDTAARLAQIRVPTLVIAGADDPGAPPEAARALADAIPAARLHVLPDCAHLSAVSHPEAWAQALLHHLQPLLGEGGGLP